jgi:cytochrome c oxidase assembly protein subunit 15
LTVISDDSPLPYYSFILPAIYFVSRGKVGPNVRWKLLALAGGIGFQGFLGWYMVKSGLSEEILSTPGAVPRVSQYRLAMHLGAALLLYTGMVHTAIGINRDWKYAMGQGKTAGVEVKNLMNVLDQPAVRRFGKWAGFVTAAVLFTAVSGESRPVPLIINPG